VALLVGAVLLVSTAAQLEVAVADTNEVPMSAVADGLCLGEPKLPYGTFQDCPVPAPMGSMCTATCAKK